jgi:hypothetical protein
MSKYRIRNKYKKSVDEEQLFENDEHPGVSVEVETNYRWGTWIVDNPNLDSFDEDRDGPFEIVDLESMFQTDIEFEELDDACYEDYEIYFDDPDDQEFVEALEKSIEENGLYDALDEHGFYEVEYKHIINSPLILEKINE